MELGVQELEAAINHWRGQPGACADGVTLAPEVRILATVYALMIYRRQATLDTDTLDANARQLLQQWRAHHPDF
jgi:hypothetical protein